MVIIMSLFYEDNIFSTITNLTYGPRLKKKQKNMTIITQYLQYMHKSIKVICLRNQCLICLKSDQQFLMIKNQF